MKRKYESELLEAIHETATGLHKIRIIDDKEMRDYDQTCLAQEGEGAVKPAKTASPAPGF